MSVVTIQSDRVEQEMTRMSLIALAASVAVGAIIAGAGMPIVQAASEEVSGENALSEYYDWYKGKRLYEQYCRFCHGQRGKGKAYELVTPLPADLTDPAIQKKSDADLTRVIHEGEPGTAMGAWNWALSEEDKQDVILYIRWLAQDPDAGIEPPRNINTP